MNSVLKKSAFLFISLMVLFQEIGFSLGEDWFKGQMLKKPKVSKKININPYLRERTLDMDKLNNGLGLQSFSLSDGIVNYMQSQINSPFIQVKSQLNLAGSHKQVLNFHFKGVPFCDAEIKASKLNDGQVFALGNIPDIDTLLEEPSTEWAKFEEVLDKALLWLSEKKVDLESVSKVSQDQCYFVDQGNVIPVWRFNLRINNLGYRFIANKNQVFRFENGFFEVSGKIKAFVKNPVDGNLATYSVELKGDSTLTSDYFKTITYGVDRAENESHEFVFEITDERFGEVNAFAHAALTYEFYKTIGYEWAGSKPLDLHVHRIIGRTKNNALYEPSDSTGTGFPAISIGDGDGKTLQNLVYDGDVVSHEFGHHVVYNTLKTISGESLVLHEGLADYFTFAKTNDACLGESICPAGSGACWVQDQCLRSGETDIKYNDATYSKISPHPRSQVVSGLLWDLHTANDVPFEDVTSLAYGAVEKLAKSSGFYDLILTLLLSDRDNLDGKYGCTIYDAAVDRGFGDVISDLDCENPTAFPEPEGKVGPGSNITAGSEEEKLLTLKSSPSCGAVGLGSYGKSGSLNLLIFMLLISPILILRSRIF